MRWELEPRQQGSLSINLRKSCSSGGPRYPMHSPLNLEQGWWKNGLWRMQFQRLRGVAICTSKLISSPSIVMFFDWFEFSTFSTSGVVASKCWLGFPSLVSYYRHFTLWYFCAVPGLRKWNSCKFNKCGSFNRLCNALQSTVQCNSSLVSIAVSDYFYQLDDSDFTSSCSSTCSSSIAKYHNSVASSYAGQPQPWSGYPATYFGDVYWSSYNLTCLTDSKTGKSCMCTSLYPQSSTPFTLCLTLKKHNLPIFLPHTPTIRLPQVYQLVSCAHHVFCHSISNFKEQRIAITIRSWQQSGRLFRRLVVCHSQRLYPWTRPMLQPFLATPRTILQPRMFVIREIPIPWPLETIA